MNLIREVKIKKVLEFSAVRVRYFACLPFKRGKNHDQ